MNSKRNILGTLIIAVTVVLSVWIGASALRHRNDGPRTITVKGSAERSFRSNLATWTLTITDHSSSPKLGFDEVERQRGAVVGFLRSHGFTDEEMEMLGVSYNERINGYYNKNQDRYVEEHDGYDVSQSIVLTTEDVDKIDKTAKAVGELINLDVTVNVGYPSYYYTKMADLKLEMLDAAAADARDRAASIAKASHGSLGALQKSQMGVFQILGRYANESYSWGGTLNTSDIDKTASITVSSTFLLK